MPTQVISSQLIEGLINTQKFQEALDFISVLPEEKVTEEITYLKGVAEVGLNNYQEAEKDLNNLWRKGANIPLIPYLLGEVYTNLHDFKRAKYFLEIALKVGESKKAAKEALENLPYRDEVDNASERIVELQPFKSDITFKDIIGAEETKAYLLEHIIMAIKEPKMFDKYGKRRASGIILYGCPGTGKTFMAKAIAGESDAYFLLVNLNQVLGSFVGSSEKNLHTVFEQARMNSPCVLFIDEIDALGAKREGDQSDGGGNSARKVMNQLLQELQGAKGDNSSLFIVSATNRPWDIDTALKRNGRLGKSIYMKLPTYTDRKQLITHLLSKKPQKAKVDIERIARATVGFSQADIDELCDEASMRPLLREKRTGKETPIKTVDMIGVAGKMSSNTDEWYIRTRNELLGRVKKEIHGKEITQSWIEGKLSPEEKPLYKELIDEVVKNSSSTMRVLKKFVRYEALYVK